MELHRYCLDCPADISHLHGNTKRCVPCSAEYRRRKDREKKRELLQDTKYRAKERARQRQARADGKVIQVRRTAEERASRTCADCGRNIGDAARNVKLCPECRGNALLASSRESAAKQRTKPEFREARKKYHKEWFRDPVTHQWQLRLARERWRTGIPGARRKQRYASDLEYRERVLSHNRTAKQQRQANARRRERYATDMDYRIRRSPSGGERMPWDLTGQDVVDQFARQKGKCGICRARIVGKFHLDHIKPVSKGGSSTADNMQITHPRCNLRKNAKMLYYRDDGQGIMSLGQ